MSERRSTFQMVAVAFGWAVSVSGFLVGGTLGGGLTFGQGVTAILLGNLVLVAVASLIGMVGYRTGMTSYLIAKNVFGRSGSVFVSIMLGFLAMGFIGVLMDAFGNAFVALVDGVPWTVVVLVFAVL
ncbi:MAG: cytosine permease, partial [Ilumatobacteraceae bacterium]